MRLQERFEILLPTYNRKECLLRTFKQILSDNSPVKDVNITVLDNKSTDGTSELIQDLAKTHKNIKHIINKNNIGGNANIAQAFVLAEKEYFWVICDDDDYDFSAWNEIETAMDKKYGLILTVSGKKEIYEILNAATFCPYTIHRRDNLDNHTYYEIYFNIANWFPHLAAVISAVNKNLPMFTPSKDIVNGQKKENGKKSFHNRGFALLRNTTFADPIKMAFLQVNYLKTLGLIKDKKNRALACEYFTGKRKSFFMAVHRNFLANITIYNHYPNNYLAPVSSLNCLQKIRFTAAICFNYILFVLFYPLFVKRRKHFEALISGKDKEKYF